MKFHNQRSFMGHEISNVNNKPLLRKKGKQWIVVAVSALILAGFGDMVSTTTHADTTNAQPTTTKVAQPSQNNGNSSKVALTSSPTKNDPSVISSSNKPVVHMLGGSNPVDNNGYNLAKSDPIDHSNVNNFQFAGKWDQNAANGVRDNDQNAATFAFYTNGQPRNSSNYVGQLDIYNGAMETNYTPNYFNQSDGSGNSEPYISSNKWTHGDDVTSIKTFNVVAPSDSSGLFAGNTRYNGSMPSGHFNYTTSMDLSGLDTSNVTNMANMFHGCWNLQHLVFGHNFNTSKVTDMDSMFTDDSQLQFLDLSSWKTPKLTSAGNMFGNTPRLESLDLANFTAPSGFYINSYWDGAAHSYDGNPNTAARDNLHELVLPNNFPKNAINSESFSEKTSPMLTNPNSSTTKKGWENAGPGSVWIDETGTGTSKTYQTYNVNFYDETSNNTSPVTGSPVTFLGSANAPFLPINNISVPNGYKLAPNAGTTATVTDYGDPSNNVKGTAKISVVPSDYVDSGTWGNDTWLLFNNSGSSKDNSNYKLELVGNNTEAMEHNNVPTTLQKYENGITNIATVGTVIAPTNSSNLFRDFPNATNLDLSNFDDSSTTNTQNMFSNFVKVITFGQKTKLNGYLFAYLPYITNTQNNTNNANVADKDVNIADGMTNHQGTWIIDYSGTMSAEASADAQSAEKAANTSASNTFTSASSWVASNSASVSDNSNWIKNHSGSLTNAYNSATSAMNSLNADSAELNWLNSSEESISSDDSWVQTHSADLNNLNRNWQSVNTRISTDEGNLNKVINTKADSSTLTSDVDTLNKDIRTASGIAAQAKQLANTNAANINTNSNTATKGISNDNASASASASAANANADSYALSLANNATDTANVNAGGIDNTINTNDQTVQSLSNTVNANTESLADNEDNLYQTKADKPAKKQSIKKVNGNLFYFYVIKPMWLHTSAKFTKGNRVKALTAKQGYTLPITRIFKVNGALRFEVKINGTKYFVTGRKDFARNAYIQPNEIKRNSSIKVLRNIREYKRAGFGKKNFIRNFKRGSVLPIKRAKTIAGKQVTRLQLTNGHWITANKNLVKLI